MKLSTEAQTWLNATVQRVMARHHLGEPERAGIHYELMSHLHSAGERKAKEAGRSEVTPGDLQAAVLEMGGEEALVQAFVAPHARPLRRAGLLPRAGAVVIDYIIILVGLAALAALLFATAAFVFLPFGTWPGWFQPWDWWFGGPPLPPFRGFLGFGLVFWLVILAYFTYLEGSRGATFGKQVFRLRVTKVDGGRIGYREALIRNLVKMFPPLLVLDALFLLLFFSNEQQRVSDRLAETIVVEGA